MLRRQILKAGTAVPALALLAACGSQSAATIDAQIVADTNGAVGLAKSVVAAIVGVDPTALTASLPSITAAENALTAAMASLSGSTPVATGASTLQTIDGYLNTILSAVGAALPAAAVAFPTLAPFVPMYDAAVALIVNSLEPYINGLLTNAPVTSSALAPLHVIQAMPTIPAARSKLNVATVKKSWF
jgi:hypothetical protein